MAAAEALAETVGGTPGPGGRAACGRVRPAAGDWPQTETSASPASSAVAATISE